MTALLEARAVEAWYGRRRALAPCSLRVTRGEVLGLYGPNGAGKTTLLQALARLHSQVRGDVLFEGMVVGRELPLKAYRRRSAVVFQDCLLLRGTVLANVALGLKLRGIGARERERRARRWLDRLRIPHLAARRARGLSGGEAQRVSLARAFVLEPDIIFLDEPFAALDSPTRDALVEELAALLQESGTTAVFVTHDPDELADLCERCLILDEGSVLQTGSVKEVFAGPQSRRVAEIIGADNIITALVESVNDEFASLDWEGERLRVPGLRAAVGTPVSLLLRPEAIEVRLPPATTPATSLAGTIVRARARGREVLLSVRLQNGRVLRAATRPNGHLVGASALLTPRPGAYWLLDPAGATPAPQLARPAPVREYSSPGRRSP